MNENYKIGKIYYYSKNTSYCCENCILLSIIVSEIPAITMKLGRPVLYDTETYFFSLKSIHYRRTFFVYFFRKRIALPFLCLPKTLITVYLAPSVFRPMFMWNILFKIMFFITCFSLAPCFRNTLHNKLMKKYTDFIHIVFFNASRKYVTTNKKYLRIFIQQRLYSNFFLNHLFVYHQITALECLLLHILVGMHAPIWRNSEVFNNIAPVYLHHWQT